jgi:tetratricopeptide (TPR) repeat protein
MNRHTRDDNLADLDGLIEEIIVDTYDESEQLSAFQQAFEDDVPMPVDAFVIGEPVSVIAILYDGNERRGLTARCRREDGSEHVVAVPDVSFPQGSSGARYLAAYRKWLGLPPFIADASAPSSRKRRHKAAAGDINLDEQVGLVALSVKERTARCRLLYSDRIITLRASGLWNLVPGEIVTVNPHKQWRYGGHPYLSGEIESARLDVAALDLKPLRLQELGIWNPDEHYWGEEDEPIQEWAKPIIARGSRPQFELEQVLPGADPADPFADPITEANDLKDAGDLEAARRRLMELCESDLRCLDAHAHLGNLVFDHGPKEAIRHYEVGVRIGELSLGDGFDGLLPWGLIDNRPLLRCMHGYGLCLWRLGRQPEARHIFDRMLWLNPADNQGVRFLIADIQNRRTWEECQDA